MDFNANLIVFESWDNIWAVELESAGNYYQESRQIMPQNTNLSTHPSRHQPKTTESTTNTKDTLPPEFDSDQSKRFITGRSQSKISTTKQIRRQRSKLRFPRLPLTAARSLRPGEGGLCFTNRGAALKGTNETIECSYENCSGSAQLIQNRKVRP